MARHAKRITLLDRIERWWEYLRFMQPAVLRGMVVAVVSAAAAWGLDLTQWGDRITWTYEALFVAASLIQAAWTRTVVSPSTINGITQSEYPGDL